MGWAGSLSLPAPNCISNPALEKIVSWTERPEKWKIIFGACRPFVLIETNSDLYIRFYCLTSPTFGLYSLCSYRTDFTPLINCTACLSFTLLSDEILISKILTASRGKRRKLFPLLPVCYILSINTLCFRAVLGLQKIEQNMQNSQKLPLLLPSGSLLVTSGIDVAHLLRLVNQDQHQYSITNWGPPFTQWGVTLGIIILYGFGHAYGPMCLHHGVTQ